MKKTGKKDETTRIIDLLKRTYYIIEIINKFSNIICMVLMISSLTVVVVGISTSNFVLSSIAFWLLLSCIIMYFINNLMKTILPNLDKTIQIVNEYYKQNFDDNN